jgi:hypothetical protein
MRQILTFLAPDHDYSQLAEVIARGVHAAGTNASGLTFVVPALRSARHSRLATVTSSAFVNQLIEGAYEANQALPMSLESADTLVPERARVVVALWCTTEMIDALLACEQATHIIALFSSPVAVAEWFEEVGGDVFVNGVEGWALARTSGERVYRAALECNSACEPY